MQRSDNLGKPRFVPGLSELTSQVFTWFSKCSFKFCVTLSLSLLIASGLFSHTHKSLVFQLKGNWGHISFQEDAIFQISADLDFMPLMQVLTVNKIQHTCHHEKVWWDQRNRESQDYGNWIFYVSFSIGKQVSALGQNSYHCDDRKIRHVVWRHQKAGFITYQEVKFVTGPPKAASCAPVVSPTS